MDFNSNEIKMSRFSLIIWWISQETEEDGGFS